MTAGKTATIDIKSYSYITQDITEKFCLKVIYQATIISSKRVTITLSTDSIVFICWFHRIATINLLGLLGNLFCSQNLPVSEKVLLSSLIITVRKSVYLQEQNLSFEKIWLSWYKKLFLSYKKVLLFSCTKSLHVL